VKAVSPAELTVLTTWRGLCVLYKSQVAEATRCWAGSEVVTTGRAYRDATGASYLLRALQISITTSTDNAIVLG